MANILIIKLGALGDVVMSTSLIKQIQSYHSADNLFLLTSKPFNSIFQGWEDLTIHTIKRKGLGNGLRTVTWIRRKRFESVYDLQSNDRSGLYCALSGITRRIGNHPRYPYNIYPQDSYQGQCHIYSRMLAVLAAAGVPVEPTTPSFPATGEEKYRIKAWLTKQNLAKNNFIIIHAGGSERHPEKRWPHHKQLAKVLLAKKKSIVWIGGNDDIEINESLSSIVGVDACMQFSFSELAELGRHASFAITNDSGPMHILSCSGVPVYTFFGPTNWRRNHAVGQEKHVITQEQSQDLGQISAESVVSLLESDGLI